MHLLLNVPLEKGQISRGNMHRASDSTRRPQLQRHEGELFAIVAERKPLGENIGRHKPRSLRLPQVDEPVHER